VGTPHPELATSVAGLVLRELTEADADEYYTMLERNREHIGRYGDHQNERRASRHGVTGNFENPPDQNIRYGIRLDSRLIGRTDLNPVAPPHYSIGYWIDELHTGRGYTTAACAALIDYARTELGATDIFAGVAHGNAKSVAVLERLGFRPAARLDTYTRYRLHL
jgi:RimJ/RimL family protein N-acetyltransferase